MPGGLPGMGTLQGLRPCGWHRRIGAYCQYVIRAMIQIKPLIATRRYGNPQPNALTAR